MESKSKLRIAHFSGPNATIQNTPPLITSNKARRKYNLPLLKNPDGGVSNFDALRAQKLAAPAKVYIEQFSAHPLERDAAELMHLRTDSSASMACFTRSDAALATSQSTRSSFFLKMEFIHSRIWQGRWMAKLGKRNARRPMHPRIRHAKDSSRTDQGALLKSIGCR